MLAHVSVITVISGRPNAVPCHTPAVLPLRPATRQADACATGTEWPLSERSGVQSLARFRMPFRTVEGPSKADEAWLFRHPPDRGANTRAVAASLRWQHRSQSFNWAYHAEHSACDAVENDLDLKCCICDHPFQSPAVCVYGNSNLHTDSQLRTKLLSCGHIFCSSCVLSILLYQGKQCADLCSTVGACSACMDEGDEGGECQGWAPCPLCRRLYCQDQIAVVPSSAGRQIGGGEGGKAEAMHCARTFGRKEPPQLSRISAAAVATAIKGALASLGPSSLLSFASASAAASPAAGITAEAEVAEVFAAGNIGT